MTGTLNGNDTDNQTVPLGEARQFACDMVPLDATDGLHGKWTARVHGPGADMVDVKMVDNRAHVVPRDPPGFYESMRELQVQCVFSTPDDERIYEFNRTISVTGACACACASFVICNCSCALDWHCDHRFFCCA